MNTNRNILYMHLIERWKDADYELYAIPYTFNYEINDTHIFNARTSMILEDRLKIALNKRGYELYAVAFSLQKAIVKKMETK